MEKCVRDIFYAVLKVDSAHINVVGINGDNANYNQNAENNFTVQVYSKLENIMQLDNTGYYHGLTQNFDILKFKFNIRPDIVLHRGNDNLDDQRMYVEVKTDPKANLSEDLRKLLLAVDDELHFENGVLIVGKKVLDRTILDILGYLDEENISNDDVKLKKLFLIHFIGIDDIAYSIIPFSELVEIPKAKLLLLACH